MYHDVSVTKIGKDSVVYGKAPSDLNVGDRSVVVGATDSRGNTILNAPMAVGYAAKAGPCSIAIGAYAGSGAHAIEFPGGLQKALSGLVKHAMQGKNEELISSSKVLASDMNQQQPKAGAILKAWQGVQALATIDGATSLFTSVSVGILAYLAKRGTL